MVGGKLDRMVKSCSVTEQLMKESDSSCDACRAKMRTPSSVTWRARDIDSDLSCGQPTAMARMPSLVIWSARGCEPGSADWARWPFLPRARLAALHCT